MYKRQLEERDRNGFQPPTSHQSTQQNDSVLERSAHTPPYATPTPPCNITSSELDEPIRQEPTLSLQDSDDDDDDEASDTLVATEPIHNTTSNLKPVPEELFSDREQAEEEDDDDPNTVRDMNGKYGQTIPKTMIS